MKKNVNHEEWLYKQLKDNKKAAEYLNAALEDITPHDKDAKKVFLLALKDLVNARGGMSYLAQKSGLNRESLYKTLSSRGNPRLDTFMVLLHALGFDLNVIAPAKQVIAKKAKSVPRSKIERKEISYQSEIRR